MTAVNERWGRFRLQLLGQLLASPPTARGQLKTELQKLGARSWIHPITGEPTHFAPSTIERWYYRAINAGTDTGAALSRCKRSDASGSRLQKKLAEKLENQYKSHGSWSARLHFYNLKSFARAEKISEDFSYQTVRRYLLSKGMTRIRRKKGFLRKGEVEAVRLHEQKEIRSYEASHVGGLWHLDMHHAKRPILNGAGEWVTPILFAVIDDHSRLICHAQWYFTETTKDLVHGFSQALMRRGLPRLLMSDNGAAMTSAEFTEGLQRLGINHSTTLPYSPHQNGKMESWWGQVESRLMAMLEHKRDISLNELNRMTQAWIEMDYHHQLHSVTKQTPLQRFLEAPSVVRPSPSSEEIRLSFRMQIERKQRRSDGSMTIEGVRYEIPGRFRHLRKVTVRYARWDLSEVSLVSQATGQVICSLYPINKEKNSNAKRRLLNPNSPEPEAIDEDIPPYLKDLIKRFDDSGMPPSFISQIEN